MKLNKKGFTLIELMIVVAIIGILAAVAVPGFMKYIKDSKKSEARTNLDAIKTGAVAFYEAEHYDQSGLNSITKVYPNYNGTYTASSAAGAASITIAGVKGSAEVSKLPDAVGGVGSKTAPSAIADGIEKMPWSTLKFKISAPFYYQYQYRSSYSAADGSKFAAGAIASLSEQYDSAFHIVGTNAGVVGAIVEAVDGSQGSAPTLNIDGFALATTTTTPAS